YTPQAGYYGPDSFTFAAKDAELSSAPVTVSLTVRHVNHAPVANAQSVQTLEGQSVAVQLSGSDVDGDALGFSLINGPSHGTLSGTAPNLTYTPAAGFDGTDSFSFAARDAELSSVPVTVSITVQDVNHAPVTDGTSIQTLSDQSASVLLSATDPDGDALVFTLVAGPSHGTLSGTLPNPKYTPAAGYSGSDSFTYTVSDGTLTSSPVVVSITVTEASSDAGSAPVANSKTAQTIVDQGVLIYLTGSDPDGDALTFSIASSPSHGAVYASSRHVLYVPAKGFIGTDTFTYQANDGTHNSAPATVTVSVTSGAVLARRR
ncbi:MAG: cadherin-like domain-containing protein, partial [Verrucomicrobiales bacterium]|nr:cadherin-like domain-containing protein [Verrucomicrobiales bacterium]